VNARKTDSPQAWLAAEVNRIRADRDLSDQGRARRIAVAYKRARDEAQQQRQAHAADWDAKRAALLRPLLGPKQHTAEWRQLRDEP
jgi:hypothetical protein